MQCPLWQQEKPISALEEKVRASEQKYNGFICITRILWNVRVLWSFCFFFFSPFLHYNQKILVESIIIISIQCNYIVCVHLIYVFLMNITQLPPKIAKIQTQKGFLF